MSRQGVVERIDVAAYTVPTDRPESDGTLQWDSTTIVVVEAHGGGAVGLGYTYGPAAAAAVVEGTLRDIAIGTDVLEPQDAWADGRAALRNAGQAGIGALALSAVDLALHDLRARVLDIPLARAFGGYRESVPVYGSGGFTTYGPDEIAEQLGGWAQQGLTAVKIKVGRDPETDPARLHAARAAVGDDVRLMVDANGAFTIAEARGWAHEYASGWGVDWFEEPVSSDNLAGLNEIRGSAPPKMEIAAGEYTWSGLDARRMLDAHAVDVLQADVTRCGGLTGLAQVDALAAAHGVPLSLHCAPAISAHVGCNLGQLVHLEYFYDHVRLEQRLFDGVLDPLSGALRPSRGQPGNGLTLRRQDAERYRA